jgi:ABC-2 type transport system ATP-binding protein
VITAQILTKAYGKTAILQGVSLHLDAGRALAVVGENGAGKTTLLKILATATMPDSGSLVIGGIDALQNPAAARERLGYVPQGIALMQELSVKDNLYYWMKTKDTAVYETVMDIIGLKSMEKRKVSRLSGGMKRRLNIGASLVLRPSLLILDEPLAGVDIANRRRIMASLSALKKSGMTIIFTSHYIDEMQMLADEMIALREGTVTYSGPLNFDNLPDAIQHYTA